MKTLFAPWRMIYIKEEAGKKKEGCLFCPAINDDRDRENLVVYRTDLTVVMMNKYPYNGGHTLVLPVRHVPGLEDLSDREMFELWDTVRINKAAVQKEMNPHGFNIGLNLGAVAGAGAPDHLHVHVVPRWEGDTNFMGVIGDTKVIPERIVDTRDKLARAFQKVINGRR